MQNSEPGPLTQEVAALIRARMARYSVTGVDLAESVRISQSQLSKITRGLRDIDLDLLERICLALEMDLPATIREAEAVVIAAGQRADIGNQFVEDGYATARNRARSSAVGTNRDTSDVDELALAANTEDQTPDEDLRTP